MGGVYIGVLVDDGCPCGLTVDALDLVEVFVRLSEGLRLGVSVSCQGHGWCPG